MYLNRLTLIGFTGGGGGEWEQTLEEALLSLHAFETRASTLGIRTAVLSVASTDSSDRIVGDSSRGSWVDVAAPGVGVLTTEPGSLFTIVSGTSFAAPHVAGTASMLFAKDPELGAAVVLHVGVRDLEEVGSLVEHLPLEAGVHAAVFRLVLQQDQCPAVPVSSRDDAIDLFDETRSRRRVGRVLRPGQGHVDLGTADVGDDAFGQPAAGCADQDRVVH